MNDNLATILAALLLGCMVAAYYWLRSKSRTFTRVTDVLAAQQRRNQKIMGGTAKIGLKLARAYLKR